MSRCRGMWWRAKPCAGQVSEKVRIGGSPNNRKKIRKCGSQWLDQDAVANVQKDGS
jgi:hypothetical protein